MRILVQICIILIFFGCSNIKNKTDYPFQVNLIVPKDKYSLILKHHFYKNFNTSGKNLNKTTVKAHLIFNTNNALSNNGSDNLTIVNGTVNFQIFDKLNAKVIKSGSISSSINTGSVSSLYGVDRNNDFAQERISKYLASKLYRKILLNIKNGEN